MSVYYKKRGLGAYKLQTDKAWSFPAVDGRLCTKCFVEIAHPIGMGETGMPSKTNSRMGVPKEHFPNRWLRLY